MNNIAPWVDEEEFAFGSALADLDGDLETFRELAVIFDEERPSQEAQLVAGATSAAALLPVLHEVANTLAVIGARLYSQHIRAGEEELRAGKACDTRMLAQSASQAMRRTSAALSRWLALRGS